MQVYPDPVRVVAIGRKVEDLLADPENKEWLSISAELCGGQYVAIMCSHLWSLALNCLLKLI